ncbi:MAG: hypothetical protein E7523_12490 [Ruminococcaceae bacterium]|nr:hypothetical protein [Oscillospiraceae bacterium]
MDEILGMLGFGSIGESDDIPTIINEFAAMIAKLIEIIVAFLKGDFSAITGGKDDISETT